MSENDQRFVIWLDDELDSDYDFALAPWKRALEQQLSRQGVRLLKCKSLSDFAGAIKKCGDAKSGGSIALLLIDVMLNFEDSKTFEPLGFSNERLIALEAGARIAGLIRSSLFDSERRPWLATVTHTPMLILSASPQAPGWVLREVGKSRMSKVEVVIKNLVRQSDELSMQPAQEFADALRRLLV